MRQQGATVLELAGFCLCTDNKGKVIPLQARRGPEGGQRYNGTLP